MSDRARRAPAPHVAWTGDEKRVALVDLSRPEQAPLLLVDDAARVWCSLAGATVTARPDPADAQPIIEALDAAGLLRDETA